MPDKFDCYEQTVAEMGTVKMVGKMKCASCGKEVAKGIWHCQKVYCKDCESEVIIISGYVSEAKQ